jgi:nitrous oxide reductase accessory protein NosL
MNVGKSIHTIQQQQFGGMGIEHPEFKNHGRFQTYANKNGGEKTSSDP